MHGSLYEDEYGAPMKVTLEDAEFSPIPYPDYDKADEELMSRLRNPEMWEGPMEESGVEW